MRNLPSSVTFDVHGGPTVGLNVTDEEKSLMSGLAGIKPGPLNSKFYIQARHHKSRLVLRGSTTQLL